MNSSGSGIIAVSTAVGRSGIGVVRMSGPRDMVLTVVRALTGIEKLKPRYAHFAEIRASDGAVIDKGLVLWFQGPHSYTGEDVAEFQVHGNPVILNAVILTALEAGRSLGLRMAEPGEFTRRAFENGRLDLAQAESVMDLINASSEGAVRAAQQSLAGEFSDACRRTEKELIGLRTNVEAILDFPEEEIDFIREGRITERTEAIRNGIRELLSRAGQGSLLREGVVVPLVGSPNVGKSSLMNALSEREVAIVTDIPGTTRDLIENTVQLSGLTVRLIDTAGLRQTDDVIESAGIRRAYQEIQKADLILHLTSPETPDESGEELEEIRRHAPAGTRVLTVVNKEDLLGKEQIQRDDAVYISAKYRTGLDRLKEEILKTVGFSTSVSGVFIARRRHIEALRAAEQSLGKALSLLAESPVMLDMVAEELHDAGTSLGTILGEFTTEDLLGEIFSHFCIGK